jgi:hypothetical protein
MVTIISRPSVSTLLYWPFLDSTMVFPLFLTVRVDDLSQFFGPTIQNAAMK